MLPLTERVTGVVDYLLMPRDGHPVAYVRAMIGAAALLRAQEAYGILTEVLRPGLLRLPYVAGVPDLSSPTLPWLIGAWALAATCFAAGFRTTVSGYLLTLLMAYVLLLDQQTYSNHLYLLIIVTFLLTAGNAGAAFSVDSLLQKRSKSISTTPTVPTWLPLLLRWQLSMLYLWGGLGKLTTPFLTGDALIPFLPPALFDWIFATRFGEVLLPGFAIFTVVCEIFLSVAVWFPALKYLTIFVGIVLHAAMVVMFAGGEVATQIQIFAFVSLALYVPTLAQTPFAKRPERL